jgi:hypothetical protein
MVTGLSKEEAAQIVDEMWTPCFGDTAPFDRVP